MTKQEKTVAVVTGASSGIGKLWLESEALVARAGV